MSDIKILTVPFDPSIGMFDDEALAGYLKDREVLRVEPNFFTCDLLDQLTTVPTDINVDDNLDDTCTPVPAGCP